MTKGIDIAKWNEVTDYAAVARQVGFAIIKIININNVEDGRFATHLAGCRANNIPVLGVYNYSYAESVSKAVTDANAVIKVMRAHNLNTTVWLDIEEQAIAKKLGTKLIDLVLAYKETINNAGYNFGVYTGMSYYNTHLKKSEARLEGIPMWIARYPSTAAMTIDKNPPESKKPAIKNMVAWQYSSKGQIAGIKGNTDLNILYVDMASLGTAPAPITTSSKYYPKYTGATNTSIISGLAGVGEKDTSYAHRAKIAAANNISNYHGTAAQNLYMLELLKQGKLIKA